MSSKTKDRMRKKLAAKQSSKTVCLVGIFKNEGKNVDRLLDSLIGIPDFICMTDTESSDDTIQKFEEWGTKHNIPTKVFVEPFKNFSHNRTFSIKMAKKAFPQADYFLLTDADFVWKKKETFNKQLLIDHKYLIEQSNKMLNYWNIRLLSSKIDWICEGVTHEYWTDKNSPCQIRTSRIKSIFIDDLEDGGCKGDKFVRDERLLREGLADKNTSKHLRTRYKFYLGQTLKDMKRYKDSIEWYSKRVEDKGWQEEVYYSKYQIGFGYEQLYWKAKESSKFLKDDDNKNLEFIDLWSEGKRGEELNDLIRSYFNKSEQFYKDSYNYRKTRAESLYSLVRLYRKIGFHEKAIEFSEIGNKICYPEVDGLFIERNCYDFLFDFEISVCAFYIKEKKDKGREATARLLNRIDTIPSEYKSLIEHNSRFYL